MLRQKQGGMGGSMSLRHEPQMRICVMGPVLVQKKSSARILESVALTSIPLGVVLGGSSHLSMALVGVGGGTGGGGLVPVKISQDRSRLLVVNGRTNGSQKNGTPPKGPSP